MNFKLIDSAFTQASEVDLSVNDCVYLFEKYNVRFTPSEKGFMCFRGTQIGLAGFGETKISALIRMLRNLDFRRNPNVELEEDLGLLFKKL